jgi:hypothetical protein
MLRLENGFIDGPYWVNDRRHFRLSIKAADYRCRSGTIWRTSMISEYVAYAPTALKADRLVQQQRFQSRVLNRLYAGLLRSP